MNTLRIFFGISCHGLFAVCLCIAGLWGCQYVGGGGDEEMPGTVTFLDVGQGLAVLLEYGGRYALYDVGPDSAGLVDTLRNRGVDSLSWVLLSHNHRDHFGGFLEFSSPLDSGAIHIGRLVVGPDTSGGFLMDSVLRIARRSRIPIDTIGRGETLFLGDRRDGSAGVSGDGLRLECLWPPSYVRVGENGASTVMRVRLNHGSEEGTILLTGDLDSLGEVRLMEISSDVSAELLQVGHHGSSHSTTLGFLNRVSPRHAVISVGRNSYGHPAEPVLRKLQYVLGSINPSNIVEGPIYRTDLQGRIAFQLFPGIGLVRLIP